MAGIQIWNCSTISQCASNSPLPPPPESIGRGIGHKQAERKLTQSKSTVDGIFDWRIRTKAKEWYWPKERHYWLATWPSRRRSVHCPMKARKVHLNRLFSIAPSTHSFRTMYLLDKNCIPDSKEPAVSSHNLDTSISFEMKDWLFHTYFGNPKYCILISSVAN